MTVELPPNVHLSTHPSLQAKISQLRSKSATSRETNALVHEISLVVACEALSKSLTAIPGPKVRTESSLGPISAPAVSPSLTRAKTTRTKPPLAPNTKR